MPELTIEGADQLRRLAERLRGADKKVRRELTSSLRPEVKRITSQVQAAVRSAPSRGRRGLGHRRRAARTLALSRGLSDRASVTRASKKLGERADLAEFDRLADEEKAKHRAKLAAKAELGAGLRESIAAATSGSISTSTGSKTTGVSVTWKVRAGRMPNSQRRLPRNFNRAKGWRHPVFGDREVWVQQAGTPYFDVTINRNAEQLGRRVVDGMQKAAESIVHET
jgi:hypothetical protein